MPTLLQIYSSHNTNSLVTRTIEYTVKQFYLMNRKPFILQMFGSVSTILDIDDANQYGRAHEVSSYKYLLVASYIPTRYEYTWVPNCFTITTNAG